MARIRSLHPGYYTDERLVPLSVTARLLLPGIWCEADDKGVFEWKPVTLKMRVLPNDNVDVADLLGELLDADAVCRFEVDGREYGAIRNFRKFQRPKSPNDIHPITDEIRKYVGLSAPISPMPEADAGAFPQKGENLPQMEDGGDGVEEKKNLAPTFERFWQAYPKRKGASKIEALAEWDKLDNASCTAALSALSAYVAQCGAQNLYTRDPKNYLAGRLWDSFSEQTEAKPEWPADFPAALRATLDRAFGADTALSWFRQCSFSPDRTEITAPNDFVAEKIRNDFVPHLRLALGVSDIRVVARQAARAAA